MKQKREFEYEKDIGIWFSPKGRETFLLEYKEYKISH